MRSIYYIALILIIILLLVDNREKLFGESESDFIKYYKKACRLKMSFDALVFEPWEEEFIEKWGLNWGVFGEGFN